MDITEKELQNKIGQYLANYFEVEFEKISDCKKSRIDIFMYHKTDALKEYPIGIEIKKSNIKKGAEIAKWLLQSDRYTENTFNNQKTLIFVCPQISGNYFEEGQNISKHDIYSASTYSCHHNVHTFLYGAFKVGEFQKYNSIKNETCIRLAINTKIIWNSEIPNLFHYDRYNKLCQ